MDILQIVTLQPRRYFIALAVLIVVTASHASQDEIAVPVFPDSSSISKIVARNAVHESLYAVPLSDESLIYSLYDALGHAKGKWNYRKPTYPTGLTKLTFYGEGEKEICSLVIGTDFVRSDCGVNRTDIPLPTLRLAGEVHSEFRNLYDEIDRYIRDSWEHTLPGLDKKVQERITELCNSNARQIVLNTVENITSVFLNPVKSGMSTSLSGDLSGISYRPPVYNLLRLGLNSIEYPTNKYAAGSFERGKHNALPYEEFDTKAWATTPRESLKSFVEIAIAPAITPADQANHIFGQTVTVRNMQTGKVLAERTEFYWLHDGGKIRLERAICPSIRRSERAPWSFLGKVINPNTYTCMNKFEADSLLPTMRNLYENRNILIDQLNRCEDAYRANSSMNR